MLMNIIAWGPQVREESELMPPARRGFAQVFQEKR